MLAHYRRDRSSLERDNIDPERIKNDLVVATTRTRTASSLWGAWSRARASRTGHGGEPHQARERGPEGRRKRATRKDAVVMADVVVTLPDNVRKGDEDRFFA